MATDLTVYLDDHPGELARVTSLLGAANVNIHGFCAMLSGGGQAEVHLLIDDMTAAFGASKIRTLRITTERPAFAGRVTSGGYGFAVEKSIAYAYLPPERAESGTAVEVEIFGEWVEGEVATEPLFDPKGERIRT